MDLDKPPKQWFDEINGFLLSIGFKPSSADPNLYIKGSVILLLYVDDMIIVDGSFPKDAYLGNSNQPAASPKDAKALSARVQIKKLLTGRYKMTDLRETRRFSGIEVIRDDNGITLAQNRYIDAILRRFGMEEAHEVRSPMDPNVQLDYTKCEDCKAENALYLSIVGSLMYVALATHPDISYCVTSLSRYNKDPLQMQLTAAKRVLRYLKHTGITTYIIPRIRMDQQRASRIATGQAESQLGSPLEDAYSLELPGPDQYTGR